MVLNQPLYAAISTSPLILVPCSYVAGAGGLSPGLIPAGNIVIPNPQSSASPDPQKNVIPTFTVMPEAASAAATPNVSEEMSPAKPEAKVAKPAVKETQKVPKAADVAKSPEVANKEESAEQPLDLSFRKKEGESCKQTSPYSHIDSGKKIKLYGPRLKLN